MPCVSTCVFWRSPSRPSPLWELPAQRRMPPRPCRPETPSILSEEPQAPREEKFEGPDEVLDVPSFLRDQ